MQALKVFALGSLFSFIGTSIYLYFALVQGQPRMSNHAIGLTGLFETLKAHTLLNPLYWLGILLSFGLAFWLVRR